MDVDSHGFYQAHHFDQPFFSCLGCGAPALDLAEVPAEAAAEAEADETAELIDVLCPVCETAVTLGPDGDCPNCGSPLAG